MINLFTEIKYSFRIVFESFLYANKIQDHIFIIKFKDTRLQLFDILILSMKKLAILLLFVLILKTYTQESEDATYLQMRRTACLVLSRYHSNTQKQVIQSAVQSLPPNDQNKYINKLYASAVLKCEDAISQSQVQEFYVENSNFDPAAFFYILEGIDYASYTQNLEFSRQEQAVVKFIKKFDEEMQIKKEESQAKKEQQSGVEERYEMKFLGFSIKDLPDSAKLIYIVIFASIIGAALWYGLSQLDQKNQKPSNKRRKSPKKDSSIKKDPKKD